MSDLWDDPIFLELKHELENSPLPDEQMEAMLKEWLIELRRVRGALLS